MMGYISWSLRDHPDFRFWVEAPSPPEIDLARDLLSGEYLFDIGGVYHVPNKSLEVPLITNQQIMNRNVNVLAFSITTCCSSNLLSSV